MRKKLTLSVDSELTALMKIEAIREGRDLSDIVEELFREYLERKKAR